MRRLATPLAVVTAAALLLSFGGIGGRPASSAALYRHYFDQGRHACAALRAGLKPQPTPFGGISSSSGSMIGVGLVARNRPPQIYQRAFLAGCQAAS